jgi:hypothetical protein
MSEQAANTPAGLAGGESAKGQDTSGTPPVGPTLERGEPSQFLKQAQGESVLDQSADYEPITDAAPESGIFHIIGGYLDEEGVNHNEVHVRSLSGEEEDFMGNRGIHVMDRLQKLITVCTERIGTITEKNRIAQAMHRLPVGSREDLIIAIRRTTHWKRHKDIYEMDVRCPISGCRKEWSYKVNLGTLDRFEMADPTKREFTVELLDSGDEVVWRVATLPQDRVFYTVGTSTDDEHLILSYGAAMRLVSVNGENVRLDIGDVLADDKKKIRLSGRAHALLKRVRKYTSGDRDQLRESFQTNEPIVVRDLDFECHHCKDPFKGELDITQNTFFFPSATSRRSKPKSSI